MDPQLYRARIVVINGASCQLILLIRGMGKLDETELELRLGCGPSSIDGAPPGRVPPIPDGDDLDRLDGLELRLRPYPPGNRSGDVTHAARRHGDDHLLSSDKVPWSSQEISAPSLVD